MSRIFLRIPFYICILMTTTLARAEIQYIDDTLYAPVRSGQSTEYRIIHKGLKSGTPVEVLQSDVASGYSLIKTQGGLEGWILTQYLSPEPIARVKLEQLAAEQGRLGKQIQELRSENNVLKSKNQQLTAELENKLGSLSSTQEELANIRRVSEDALQLDSKNRELRESNEKLKNEVEVLTSENLRLKDRNEQDTMLLSAGLVLAGVLIAVIVPMFKREKKSSW
jgi:SH3 domain protein